jgi:hypothetical protein
VNEECPQPAPGQAELPLPFPEFTGDMPLRPARMVNEYPRRKAAAATRRALGGDNGYCYS